MKKIWYTVKLGFTKLGALAMVAKARTNVKMLTGNATYATPIPALAAITAGADALESANNAYEFTRSRLDQEARDVAYIALKGMLKELGGYVQAVSGGDKDLILSAGFETERLASPVGPLPAPPNVRALVTAFPGMLEVKWGGVKGRANYTVSICEEDPKVEANWSLHAITSKNRLTVSELQSDKVYYFRVVAMGAAGASPVSDIASAKAA